MKIFLIILNVFIICTMQKAKANIDELYSVIDNISDNLSLFKDDNNLNDALIGYNFKPKFTKNSKEYILVSTVYGVIDNEAQDLIVDFFSKRWDTETYGPIVVTFLKEEKWVEYDQGRTRLSDDEEVLSVKIFPSDFDTRKLPRHLRKKFRNNKK